MDSSQDRKLTMMALALTALVYSGSSFGFDASVTDASKDGDIVRVTAKSKIQLSNDVIEALQSHIDITITIQVKIYRIRKSIWDNLTVDYKTAYVISNSDTYNRYILRSSDGQLIGSFSNLQKVLREIGRSRTYEATIVGEKSQDPDSTYRGKYKIFLDRSKLPAEMKTLVYFKNSWRLESAWVGFELQ